MSERPSAESTTRPVKRMRGSVMSEARETIRQEWGFDAYQAMLARLGPDDRRIMEGALLATNFYPIATWDRFLIAAAAEVELRTGANVDQFYSRLVELAGGRMLKMLYRMSSGPVSPTIVATLIPNFWERLLTSGHFELAANEPGRCVTIFTDDCSAYRHNLVHHMPLGITLMFTETGAQNVQSSITREELRADGYLLEVTTIYDV